VAGRNINGFLPAGGDARTWVSIGNEMQMLLHRHPVNERREQEGRLTANGLWFWGGGTLPARAVASWRHVWSDDPLVKGLAAISQSPVSPLPAEAQGIGRDMQAGGKFLVVLDADHGSPEEPHPLLRWLPLLSSGLPARITLQMPGEPVLTFSGSAVRPGWRQLFNRLPGFRKD
jgi:hypothetical protein